MGGGADAGQIFRMSRSTKNHPRAGLLPVGSLLETVGSLSVDRWTRQVSYYGWMRRLLLPLDVGIELWVDPHTPRLCSTGGVGAPDRRRRRCELSRLFHEPDVAPGCLFAAGRIEAEFLRLGDAHHAAQEWADNSLQANPPCDDLQRAPGFRQYASGPSLLDGHSHGSAFREYGVEERGDRPFHRRSERHGGLLPGMPEGPRRDRVAAALATFQERTKDTRLLANFVLHSGTHSGWGYTEARRAEWRIDPL